MEINKTFERQIKEFFKNKERIQTQSVNLLLKQNKEIALYLENIFKETPEWESITNIVIGIVKEFQLKKCRTCGKLMTYHKSYYRDFCSHKCSSSNNDIIEIQKLHRKEFYLKNYGVENGMQIQEIKDKIKQTSLEKYGTEYPLQSDIVQEKRKNTCIQKYGEISNFKTAEFKEKSKNTCLIKYGKEYANQNPEIRKKIEKSYNNKTLEEKQKINEKNKKDFY